jgi:predicted metal-dependent enzyme (double-stranded beta helix superfamily)
VAVLRGELREKRLRLGAPPASAAYPAGALFDFSAADIHRVTNPGPAPAVSVHAYSPPLRSMGSYIVGGSGALRRMPLGATDELRPLSA